MVLSVALVGSITMSFTGTSGRFPSTWSQEAPELFVKKMWPRPSHPFTPGQEKPEYAANADCALAESTAMAVTLRSGWLVWFTMCMSAAPVSACADCQIRPSDVPAQIVFELLGATAIVVTKFWLLSLVKSAEIADQLVPPFIVWYKR